MKEYICRKTYTLSSSSVCWCPPIIESTIQASHVHAFYMLVKVCGLTVNIDTHRRWLTVMYFENTYLYMRLKCTSAMFIRCLLYCKRRAHAQFYYRCALFSLTLSGRVDKKKRRVADTTVGCIDAVGDGLLGDRFLWLILSTRVVYVARTCYNILCAILARGTDSLQNRMVEMCREAKCWTLIRQKRSLRLSQTIYIVICVHPSGQAKTRITTTIIYNMLHTILLQLQCRVPFCTSFRRILFHFRSRLTPNTHGPQ